MASELSRSLAIRTFSPGWHLSCSHRVQACSNSTVSLVTLKVNVGLHAKWQVTLQVTMKTEVMMSSGEQDKNSTNGEFENTTLSAFLKLIGYNIIVCDTGEAYLKHLILDCNCWVTSDGVVWSISFTLYQHDLVFIIGHKSHWGSSLLSSLSPSWLRRKKWRYVAVEEQTFALTVLPHIISYS